MISYQSESPQNGHARAGFQAIGGSLGFRVLLKGTLTHSQEEPGYNQETSGSQTSGLPPEPWPKTKPTPEALLDETNPSGK